jgi:HlyD family secretion protein
MSTSMWTWRVIVPVLGLSACLYVFYQTYPARGGPTTESSREPSVDRAASRTAAGRVIAEGRLAPRPGAEVTVGTEAGGTVINLLAREKASVRKGDVLVEFQSDDQKAALAEAEAKLAEAEAEFTFQNGEFQRRSKAKTEAKQFVAELEGTRRDLAIAEARRRAGLALVARCRSNLARTRVVAPIDGVVLACHVQAGETAPPGSRLVTVCDLARVRVEAEIDEFDAARIAPGDEATITAEGSDGLSWKGTVEEVPDRVAERTVRPEDPGRPADTRVLLVKIALEKPSPLKLGQRVEIEIRPRR